MVGPDGLEPSTPRLSSACSNQLSYEPGVSEIGGNQPRRASLNFGGAGEIRTRDPLLAKQVLYQLSYDPEIGRLYCKELLVLNIYFVRSTGTQKTADVAIHRFLRPSGLQPKLPPRLLRKEVIQPQVPLRLPCYDFVPITSLTLGRRLHCWLANALRAKPAFMT